MKNILYTNKRTKIKKTVLVLSKHIFIVGITLVWIFSGWPKIWENPQIPPKISKTTAAEVKDFGNEKISFTYTDENNGENIIIKTNKKDYTGLTRSEVYFSATNIGNKSERVGFQFYFPQNQGTITKIEKWEENIPYEINVPDFGTKSYFCDNGWQKITDKNSEEFFGQYQCQFSKEIKNCDSLSQDNKTCVLNKVQIGSHKTIKYRGMWREEEFSKNPLVNKQNLLKKIIGLEPNKKSIPKTFKVKKNTSQSYLINPGETQYFKAEISFPINSSGEFYIEAIGDKFGYGLLDPWWNSSWNYRKPITINNANNPNTLTDYQIYVELTNTETDFWSNVKSDGGDVRFIASDNTTELNYWKQYWDYTNNYAAFWVQVDSIPASSTTTIYMYYGNSSATTTSSETAPFTYSTMQDLYYVVNNDLAGVTVEVVSLIDNNQVQLDNQTPVNLNRQQIASFSSPTAVSVLRAKGPVHAKLKGDDNVDALVPISFAGTQFVVPSTRGTENFYVYAPFATATVTLYNGSTQVAQQTIAQGTEYTFTYNITSMAIIESDKPVLVSFDNSSPYDGMVIYPTTNRDLYGIRSQNNYIGIATNSTNFSIGCSGGSGTSVSNQNRGTLYSNTTCSNGSEGTGNAVRIYNINNGIGAIQQADSDGGESTIFLPPSEFGTEYMLPTNAAYLAVACAPDQGTVNLSIYDENNNFVTSGTCSGSGNNPGKAYFGNGDTTTYNAGSRIVSTDTPAKPFYVYYEDTTAPGAGGGDENNLWSWPQARKYSYPHPSYSLGTQESNASQTTQLHFRWRDDSTDLNTSGGWLAAENSNSIGDINKNTIYRLRIEVANTGNQAESASRTYELQWGEKPGSSCASISTWTGVGDASDEFDMVDTANISPDGQSTSPPLLSNTEGYTYTTGEGRDVADTTGSIGPLSANYYTELEYSFKATDNAVPGATYCFRLYDTTANSALDSYFVYPEVTIGSVTTNLPIGEYGTITLNGNATSTVTLTHTYTNLVVVASPRYAPTSDTQRAPRITAKTSNSFDIKVDNYSGSLTGSTVVDWIAMEAGSYTIPDGASGTKVIAGTQNTSVQGYNGNWPTGTYVSFNPAFDGNPAVIHTVASNNAPGWTVSTVNDGTQAGEPTPSGMYVLLNTSFDIASHGSAEDIDYIAFDTGHGTNNGTEFDAVVGNDTVSCCTTAGYPTNFSSSFSSAPRVYLISQMGEDGGNGGYALTHTGTAVTTTTHYGSIDEDGPGADRSHTSENVAIIAFGSSSGTIVGKEIALDQTTYRFYDNADGVQPGTAKAPENTPITGVATNDVIRIRMSVQVGLNDLPANSLSLKLQYGQGSNCSAISTWTDVDSVDGTGIWRGYDNTTPIDGSQVTSSLLNSQNNALESYEEQNNSAVNPSAVSKGNWGEWDWVVQDNGAPASTDYCFRTVLSDGSIIQYTNYPKLTTIGAVVSVSVSDGAVSYGIIPAGTSESTCTSELNDAQVVTNDGNVTENFNIRGQDSASWTLGTIPGTDIYVHKFSTSTCTTWTNGTALTTTDQTLATGIPPNSTTTLNLQITTPNNSSAFTQQSVDVIITAVQQ